jgi:diguanylate cyclase (GGDEF)-like protein
MLARVHRRLILFAVLLSGATLMISGLLTIREYFERNLALVARTISYAIEPAVVFGDGDAIREGIASVAAVHEVRLVELRGKDGRVLSRWAQPAAGSDAPGNSFTERLLHLPAAKAKITHGSQVIGEVSVAGDTGVLTGYLLSGALISLCCLGITIIAMRILGRRMEEGVVGPLADIALVAHEVRSQRAFDRRVRPSDIAEIDKFGRDFKALLAELQGWHVSLTEEKDKLEHEATHDRLTGLGNRALFERSLEAEVAETVRSRTSFALLYLDADHFKQVNDVYGHMSGDALLVGIAQRLRGCIRDKDAAFRLGGDEFAIILGNGVDHSLLDAVTMRLQEALSTPIAMPSGRSLNASLSIGAAIYPDDGISPDDMLRRADERMYEDKVRKRGTLRVQGSHA